MFSSNRITLWAKTRPAVEFTRKASQYRTLNSNPTGHLSESQGEGHCESRLSNRVALVRRRRTVRLLATRLSEKCPQAVRSVSMWRQYRSVNVSSRETRRQEDSPVVVASI